MTFKKTEADGQPISSAGIAIDMWSALGDLRGHDRLLDTHKKDFAKHLGDELALVVMRHVQNFEAVHGPQTRSPADLTNFDNAILQAVLSTLACMAFNRPPGCFPLYQRLINSYLEDFARGYQTIEEAVGMCEKAGAFKVEDFEMKYGPGAVHANFMRQFVNLMQSVDNLEELLEITRSKNTSEIFNTKM